MIKFLVLCVPLLVQLNNCWCQIIKDYESLDDSYPVHKHLNNLDLWELFNTRDPKQIGRYNLVKVIDHPRSNLNKDQNVADKVLTIESVSNTKSVKYIIALNKNKHLIHEDLKDHRHLENCLFLGSVIYPGEGGNAALSNCDGNGYSGSIQLHGKTVKLHALPIYLISNKSLIHIMQESGEDEPTELDSAISNIIRTKRQISRKPLYMELNVALDNAFQANLPRNRRILKAFSYLNQVQGIYLHPTLGRKMYIFIKNFEISPVNFNGVTNIITYLNRFCAQQRNLPRIDNSILLTGKNLNIDGNNGVVGVAWLRGTCRPNSRCGIIEERGSSTAEIIAHEIGHNIGMDHDCRGQNCNRNCNIFGLMGPFINGVTRFSTCSRRDFEDLLRSNSFRCLVNFPKDQRFYRKLTRTIQGRFSLSALCDYYFPGSKATKNPSSNFNNPCNKLFCKLRSGNVRAAPAPAFKGMRCDLSGSQVLLCNNNKKCVKASTLSSMISRETNDEILLGRKKRAAKDKTTCTKKYWECNCGKDDSVDKLSCIKVCGGCVEVFANNECSSPMPKPNSSYCQKQCKNK